MADDALDPTTCIICRQESRICKIESMLHANMQAMTRLDRIEVILERILDYIQAKRDGPQAKRDGA